MMLSHLVEEFTRQLYGIGAFKTKSQSPNGKGFRLKLHETNPDAPLSPFYLDFRIMRSFPLILKTSAQVFQEMMKDSFSAPHLLADIPQAITPTVAVLSQRTEIGMITPREPKTHGSGAVIDGVFHAGQSVLVFDDLITQAHSKISVVKTLTSHNLKVLGVLVLADRQQGGRQQLEQENIPFRAAFDLDRLLESYYHGRLISRNLYDEIQAYRRAS